MRLRTVNNRRRTAQRKAVAENAYYFRICGVSKAEFARLMAVMESNKVEATVVYDDAEEQILTEADMSEIKAMLVGNVQP